MSDAELPFGTYRNTLPVRKSSSQEITLSQEESTGLAKALLCSRAPKRKMAPRLPSSTKRLKTDSPVSYEDDLTTPERQKPKKMPSQIFDPDVAEMFSMLHRLDAEENDFDFEKELTSTRNDHMQYRPLPTDHSVQHALMIARQARNNVHQLNQSVTRMNSQVFDLIEEQHEPAVQISVGEDPFEFAVAHRAKRAPIEASASIDLIDEPEPTKPLSNPIEEPETQDEEMAAYLRELDAKILQTQAEAVEERIQIGVKFSQNEKKMYRLRPKDPFSKLIAKIIEKGGVPAGKKLKLIFDGAGIDPSECPADHDMEDDDLLDAKFV